MVKSKSSSEEIKSDPGNDSFQGSYSITKIDAINYLKLYHEVQTIMM